MRLNHLFWDLFFFYFGSLNNLQVSTSSLLCNFFFSFAFDLADPNFNYYYFIQKLFKFGFDDRTINKLVFFFSSFRCSFWFLYSVTFSWTQFIMKFTVIFSILLTFSQSLDPWIRIEMQFVRISFQSFTLKMKIIFWI